MAKFQIQKSSSTVNWTGKKVLGLHTGSINIANGFIEIADNKINRWRNPNRYDLDCDY